MPSEERDKSLLKVEVAVLSFLERTEEIEEAIKSYQWVLGKVAVEETEDFSEGELENFVTRVCLERGYSPRYLRDCMKFFRTFPDLQEVVEETGISPSKLLLLVRYNVWDKLTKEELKEIAKMSYREIKQVYCKKRWCAPPRCNICYTPLRIDKKGIEWKKCEICADCLEKAKKYDELKEKYDRIRIKLMELKLSDFS